MRRPTVSESMLLLTSVMASLAVREATLSSLLFVVVFLLYDSMLTPANGKA